MSQHEKDAQQESAASLEVSSNTSVPVKRKWLVGILTLIGLVGIGAASMAFIAQSSPKNVYLMSEANAYDTASEEFEQAYGDLLELSERTATEASKSEVKVTGGFSMPNLAGDPSMLLINSLLGQVSLQMETQINPEANETLSSLGISLQEQELIGAEFYRSQEQSGVQVPQLFDEYYYIQNDEFGNVMRTFDPMYRGLESISYKQLTWENIKLSEEESNYLADTYGKLLYDNLPEESFTMEEGASVEYEGATVDNLRQITLQLSEDEIYAIFQSLWKKAATDEVLHDMIVGRYEMFLGTQTNADNVISVEEFENELHLILENDIQNIGMPEGVTSVVWVDGDEQIVKRELSFTTEGGPEPVAVSLLTHNVPMEAGAKQQWSAELTNNNSAETITLDLKKDKMSDESSEYSFEVGMNVDGTTSTTLVLNGSSELVNEEGTKKTFEHAFDLSVDEVTGTGLEVGLSGEILEVRNIALEDDRAEQEYDMTLLIDDGAQQYEVELEVDSTTIFTDNLDFPNFDEVPSVYVGEMTSEEFTALGKDISARFQEIILEYQSLFLGL